MKTLSVDLKNHLAQEVTTLATCWRVVRKDGMTLGFTDHDVDLVFEAVTYQSATGYTASASSAGTGLEVDNLEIMGVLDATTLTEADLQAGLYDFAALEIFLLNHADLSQGKMILHSGILGEVSTQGESFKAEFRGLGEYLKQSVGEVYSRQCAVDLGDSKCQVALAAFTVIGTVTGVTSRNLFTVSQPPAGPFGKLTFTGGGNEGFSGEVAKLSDSEITLALPMPRAVTVGDAYSVYAGCDKRVETCQGTFGNILNFRGFPHIPGTDAIVFYPDAH